MSDNQEAAQRTPGVAEAWLAYHGARSAAETHVAVLALESAIASHAVQAERARLLALTEESVVEEAAKALQLSDREAYADTQTGDEPSWEESDEKTREDYRRCVRAAAPLLVAGEVAKREAVEAEHRASFDLYHSAMERGRKLYHERHPDRKDVWPDAGAQWYDLLDRLSAAEERVVSVAEAFKAKWDAAIRRVEYARDAAASAGNIAAHQAYSCALSDFRSGGMTDG